MMVWTYGKDDGQQSAKEDIWIVAKRMEQKGKCETNVNTQLKLVEWGLEDGAWEDRVKWVQEDVQRIVKPDNK